LLPHAPLQVGQKAKVLTLIPCDELFPTEEESTARHYTTKDIGVWGTVVRVRMEETEVVEFVLKNDNIQSSVTYAYLAVPRKEGLTTNAPCWRRMMGMIVGGLASATRTIPVEDDVTVFDDGTTLKFAGVSRV
ncbi:hypothetical protein OH77DRAFT_1397945, partial [Trametes cingulata]